MKSYIYELKMKVRDYECDLQGIVNNANYLHYTEHTRHEFLLSRGVSFAQLHSQGIDCVVARLTMQFKVPLTSGDEFASRLRVEKQGIKYVFFHDIYRLPDEKLALRSQVEIVCLVNGTLGTVPFLDQLITPVEVQDEGLVHS
jgi:acyl-CoA thioester hydrolase